MQQLSEHLFRVEDTCSVYGVRAGGRTLLIDCGTDLRSRDVGAVDRVPAHPFSPRPVFRHLALAGTGCRCLHSRRRTALPGGGRPAAGGLLRLRQLHRLPSGVRAPAGRARSQDGPGLRNHRVAGGPLRGGFRCPDTHSVSTGYLFKVDGRRVLACGDLMTAPGRLGDYHWLQWSYMDFQGHVNQLESLACAAELEWDLMLPGHGAPFTREEARIDELSERLAELHSMFFDQPYTPFQVEFRRLSPHVYEVSSMANSYVVKDDAGHAVLIDCGYVSGAPITANPHRYIDHLTPRLHSELGVKTVEYFLPTHFHDDHLAGYPDAEGALRHSGGGRPGTAESPRTPGAVRHALHGAGRNADRPGRGPRGTLPLAGDRLPDRAVPGPNLVRPPHHLPG